MKLGFSLTRFRFNNWSSKPNTKLSLHIPHILNSKTNDSIKLILPLIWDIQIRLFLIDLQGIWMICSRNLTIEAIVCVELKIDERICTSHCSCFPVKFELWFSGVLGEFGLEGVVHVSKPTYYIQISDLARNVIFKENVRSHTHTPPHVFRNYHQTLLNMQHIEMKYHIISKTWYNKQI